ncbi:MAG: hypothetical protein HY231_11330 [Acidobacteria bacterium]|nr:hypothetical protein [Acidobacteriota bacterium]
MHNLSIILLACALGVSFLPQAWAEKFESLTFSDSAAVVWQSSPSPSADAKIEGVYDAEITDPKEGTMRFVLIIKKDGDKLATEVKEVGGDEDFTILGIKLEGDAVTLLAAFQGFPFEMNGKRSGAEMSGKWEADQDSGTWSAKKRTGN